MTLHLRTRLCTLSEHDLIAEKSATPYDSGYSAGKRKFPYHPKVKEIRFLGKIGFLIQWY